MSRATKLTVHSSREFLSSVGAEPRILTAPLPLKEDKWDWRHTTVASRHNHDRHSTFKEYFDRPRPISSCGANRPGMRVPSPFGRPHPLVPLCHESPEMPQSPSPLSPGCHGRGRFDRGTADYTFDGALSLTLVSHPPFDQDDPASLKAVQRMNRVLSKERKETHLFDPFVNDSKWDHRWPGHDRATRTWEMPGHEDEDPFNQREEERPETKDAPPRCHFLVRSCAANMQPTEGASVQLHAKENGLVYWTTGSKDVSKLVPLAKMDRIKPRDILLDALQGTAPPIVRKELKLENLEHTAFTGL